MLHDIPHQKPLDRFVLFTQYPIQQNSQTHAETYEIAKHIARKSENLGAAFAAVRAANEFDVATTVLVSATVSSLKGHGDWLGLRTKP